MTIYVTGDKNGRQLAVLITEFLSSEIKEEIILIDMLATELYPQLAERVCNQLKNNDRAILICGTGIGISIAANKMPGIRAALVHDCYSAERAALSNDANVIAMGAQVIGSELAKCIVMAWINKRFNKQSLSAKNVAAINNLDVKER